MSKHAYTFKPYIPPGHKTYAVKFFHPLQRRQVTRGLGTEDPKEAHRIADDIRSLCTEASHHPQYNLHKNAIGAFFGKDSAEFHAAALRESVQTIETTRAGQRRSIRILLDDIERMTRDLKNFAEIQIRCALIDQHFVDASTSLEQKEITARLKQSKKRRR